jgi:indoleamine 2,3-dioxygenase
MSLRVITPDTKVDPSESQFLVSTHRGFLPREDSLSRLPKEFSIIDKIMDEAPRTKNDGSHGLLWSGKFGETAEKELPLFDFSKITDTRLLHALHRDYTLMCSFYILEPCDIEYRKSKTYGLGRSKLTKNIAVPLVQLAEKLDAKPFLEYSLGYAVANFMKVDPKLPITWENIQLIRKLAGNDDEKGFILVHILMAQHTGEQVVRTLEALEAAETKNR